VTDDLRGSSTDLSAASAWRILAAVLVVGAGLRIASAARLGCISRDGAFYVAFARQLADDPVRAMQEQLAQPGYSAMLLAVHGLAGGWMSRDPVLAWERCGQSIACAAGAAVIALLYALGLRLFDRTTALAAAALAAVWTQAVELSADVLTDMPHLALYLAAVLLLLAAVRTGRRATLAAGGFIAGMAYLMRQEALGLPLAGAACWMLSRSAGGWRRRTAGVALLAAAFAVPVAPYALATGKLMHKKSIWQLLQPPADPAADDPAVSLIEPPRFSVDMLPSSPIDDPPSSRVDEPASFAVDEPPSSAVDEPPGLSRRSHRAGSVTIWSAPLHMLDGWARSGRYVLSTLAVLGMVWPAVRRAEPTGRRLFVVLVGLHVAAVLLRGRSFGEISSRYMVVPAALSIPWAGAALAEMARRMGRVAGRPAALARAAGTTLGMAALVVMLAPLRSGVNADKRGLRDAGTWLRAHSRPEEVVIAPRKLSPLLFYADRVHFWPDAARDDEIAAALRAAGPAWYIDHDESPRGDVAADAVRRCLIGDRPASQPAHLFTVGSGRTARIYRLSGP